MRILIFIIFMFISCQPAFVKEFQKQREVYGIDFREYSKKGFLFTPYQYDSNYEPIGLVRFVLTSKAKYIEKVTYLNPYPHWDYEHVSLTESVEFAYKEALEMGADAIVDFKIVRNSQRLYVGKAYEANIPQIEVSGFAIKRKY
ncbi:MAG: hypothetical protein V3V16_12890 [Melioribacteraceae bacterium]